MIIESLMQTARELPTFKTIDGSLTTFGHLFQSLYAAMEYKPNIEPQSFEQAIELLELVLDALQWYAGLANEVGYEMAEKQADVLIRQTYQTIDHLNDRIGELS